MSNWKLTCEMKLCGLMLIKWGNYLIEILRKLEKTVKLLDITNRDYDRIDGNDVYQSVEEKATNFLYFIVKNHVFIDGNKRIGACLFIFFLSFYDILYKDNSSIISSMLLTTLTLLNAQLNPKEKDILISLTMNFLT